METSAALLLLLIIISGQHGVARSFRSGDVFDISSCPLTVFGQTYQRLEVTLADAKLRVCFQNSPEEGPGDCVQLGGQIGATAVHVDARQTRRNAEIRRLFQHYEVDSPCGVAVTLRDARRRAHASIYLENYGKHSALGIKTTAHYQTQKISLKYFVAGEKFLHRTASTKKARKGVYYDISGCRGEGQVLHAGRSEEDRDSCATLSCSKDLQFSRTSNCPPGGVCQGNNSCVAPQLCSVVGSSVISFSGELSSVSTRCVYSLLRPDAGSQFELLAGFRERRRTDVALLDHLILSVPESKTTVFLEQGGRVQLQTGDDVTTFTEASRLIPGLSLRTDRAGVVLEINRPISSQKITVVFDGRSAHVSALGGTAASGLCGSLSDPTNIPDLTPDLDYSPPDCDREYTQEPDDTVDCDAMTAHCKLLNQDPFAACHSSTDPAPYVQACVNTLCQYPAADGLRCQMLEAYEKACAMNVSTRMEDWRSKAGCSPESGDLCQNKQCADHEFCAEVGPGETRCFCRAIFASKFRKRENRYGQLTACGNGSASITLVGCLLQEDGLQYGDLHLKDQTCSGQLDSTTNMLTFSFDLDRLCGTEITTDSRGTYYKNAVLSSNNVHHDPVQIDFSCFFPREMMDMTLRMFDSSVKHEVTAGIWNYTLKMDAYLDSGRTNPVTPTTDVIVSQRVWLEVTTEGLDHRFVAVVTDSCKASNQPTPDEGVSHPLIRDGCAVPNPSKATVVGNGLGLSNYFSFNLFKFSGEDNFYVHCRVRLCHLDSDTCIPTCDPESRKRRRRSPGCKYPDANTAFISMTWTV